MAQACGDRGGDDDAADDRAGPPADQAAREHARGTSGRPPPAFALGERLGHDERGQQRRGEQAHDVEEAGRQLAAAEEDRPGGLDRCRDDRVMMRTTLVLMLAPPAPRPARAGEAKQRAEIVASTGTPAGANGTSASAISAPIGPRRARAGAGLADQQADEERRIDRVEAELSGYRACRRRARRRSGRSSRSRTGRRWSRTAASGRRSRRRARRAPTRRRPPSGPGRHATCIARPGSDGASATPIGRKREFISAAAPIAAPTPPPPARGSRPPVNCAEPA